MHQTTYFSEARLSLIILFYFPYKVNLFTNQVHASSTKVAKMHQIKQQVNIS